MSFRMKHHTLYRLYQRRRKVLLLLQWYFIIIIILFYAFKWIEKKNKIIVSLIVYDLIFFLLLDQFFSYILLDVFSRKPAEWSEWYMLLYILWGFIHSTFRHYQAHRQWGGVCYIHSSSLGVSKTYPRLLSIDNRHWIFIYDMFSLFCGWFSTLPKCSNDSWCKWLHCTTCSRTEPIYLAE